MSTSTQRLGTYVQAPDTNNAQATIRKTFDSLSEELIVAIFLYIKDPSHSAVCKHWQRLYNENTMYYDLTFLMPDRADPNSLRRLAIDNYSHMRQLIEAKNPTLATEFNRSHKKFSLGRNLFNYLTDENIPLKDRVINGSIGFIFGVPVVCIVCEPIQFLGSAMNAIDSKYSSSKPYRTFLNHLEWLELSHGKLSNKVFDFLANTLAELNSI
ncbi:MAG: hypothetical protein KAR79_06165 [Simkaniaceae bacterium]|nr:hypothetical protein [Simkaniaceae bacterium]